MHYKNGRSVELGDFIVGVTHNSGGQIVFGVVLQQMPLQGDCNIRISRIELSDTDRASDQERGCLPFTSAPNNWCLMTGNFDDYGNAADFIKVEDGLRLSRAAELGKWDSPYMV